MERNEVWCGRSRIRALIPHQGAMCLLDEIVAWDEAAIHCRARSHLDPANPLRRDGRLATVCGLEYGLQAAALHGALRGGGIPQPAGWLAALRAVVIAATFLDEPATGVLQVHARAEHAGPSGLIYAIRLESEHGQILAEGRATIALQTAAQSLKTGGLI